MVSYHDGKLRDIDFDYGSSLNNEGGRIFFVFDYEVPPAPEYTGKYIYSFYASNDPLDCIGKLTAYFENGKRCGVWYFDSLSPDMGKQRIYFRNEKVEKIHVILPPFNKSVLFVWGDDGRMKLIPPCDIYKYDLIDKPSVIPAAPQKTDEQIKALQDLIKKDLQRNVP